MSNQYSIPKMEDALKLYLEDVMSAVTLNSGHVVPKEQPEVLAKAPMSFLQNPTIKRITATERRSGYSFGLSTLFYGFSLWRLSFLGK
jgi:hypothetical protein